MKHSRPMLTSNSACPAHRPLALRPWPAIRPLNPFVRHSTVLGLVGLASALLAAPTFAAAPAIIPLPQQLQVRSALFPPCPSQPIPGAPARATQKILVDGASLQTGQFLATTLFKSTGYQFIRSEERRVGKECRSR